MNLFKVIVYARACAYKEAYIAETRSGGGSTAVAAFLVGVFDAPLIMAVLLIFDSFFFEGSVVREGFSSNLTSAFSITFTIFVLLFEYIYYCVFKVGIKRSSLLPNRKVVGIAYTAISLIGGGVLVYLFW